MALSHTTSHHSGSDHVSADEECVEEPWDTYFEHEQLKTKTYITFTWMLFPSVKDMLPFCDALFEDNVHHLCGGCMIPSSPMNRTFGLVLLSGAT